MRHHSPSIPAVSAGISGQNRYRPCGLGGAAPVDSVPALTHDSDKLIRQLSLVAYLMAEQRPVTARDVKNNVEGYANMGDEAFARRYYADRSELQGLGVPITSGRDEFTGEELYNLRQEHYFLPPIDLTDAELAALQTSFYLLEGQFAYAEPLRLALQNLALAAPAQSTPAPRRPRSSCSAAFTHLTSPSAWPSSSRRSASSAPHASRTGRRTATPPPSAPSTPTACSS